MNKLTLIALLALLSLAISTADMRALAQTSRESNSAKRNISGVVTDKEGNPVIGAAVTIVGTTTGTITNPKGEYSLECRTGDQLRFTYIGYDALEATVAVSNIVDVTLAESNSMLEDVIVIGYGTTTRKSAVGAVDQIKSSVISERSTANMTQALQGTSPSLVIQQRNFNPNGDNALNLNIRGLGTMNDNSPLIVIDGMIVDNAAFNRLNPQDIENVSVLKDAGSAAIYGSRSANGVLLVTTKKGRQNQAMTVKLTTMIGVQQPNVLYTPVDGYVNATLKNLRLTNGGDSPAFTPAQINDLYEHGNGKYFMDEILQNALQQNYNLSVSGGGANSTYLISAGYYDQQSNFVGPDLGVKRYNIRANVSSEYKRFKVTGLLAYSRDEGRTATSQGNAIADASRVPNYYYYKQYDAATGKYLLNDILGQFNSLGMLKEGGVDIKDNDYMNLNTSVEYTILKGFKIKGSFGADVFSNHSYSRNNMVNFYESPESTVAKVTNLDLDSRDWNERKWQTNSQLMLDYNVTIKDKHTITALVGASNESFTASSNQVAMKFVDPDLGIKGDGTSIVTESSWLNPERAVKRSITSIFGRANYNYNDIYYVEGTFRYDGSSKFSKSNRWGFFPSVSAGWRISEENWMQSFSDKVGNAKIRMSYGTLGNQSIGDYQYFTTYDVYADTYGFDNKPVGGAGFSLGNENLRWEISRSFNVGADLSFFKNSLVVTFDYFNKNTKDILVPPIIPLIVGTAFQSYNAGEMRTQGWEVTINYNLRHGDFSHGFQLNMGDSWNKVLKFDGFENIRYNDGVSWINRVGLPINSYYGLKVQGIFQNYDQINSASLPSGANVTPGDIQYVDRNNDGAIDGNDRYYLGNAFPRYTFGFNYNFAWKGLDFSFFLQGVAKRDMMVRGEMMEPFHANYFHLMFKHQLDYWTPTNTEAKYPQLTSASGSQANNYGTYGLGSSIYQLNGSYLRLKNIQLGYTLPAKWTSVVGMQKVKIYVNAQNLFTLSHNSFIDPESSELDSNMGGGSANSARNYPTLRYFGMGLDVTF